MSLSRKQTKDRVLLFGTEMNYLLEAEKKKTSNKEVYQASNSENILSK